jgi:DNA-binding XRE family transcriptional regulator
MNDVRRELIVKKKNIPYSKLKGLRVEKGLTAEKMAGLLGVSTATYRRKENRTDGADFYIDEAKKVGIILSTEPKEIFLLH